MHYPFGYDDLDKKFVKYSTNYTDWRVVGVDDYSTFASKRG